MKSAFVGCATEYRAANYFLEQGIPVFWPAVHASRFDFLILRDGKYQRVQVKTAWRRGKSDKFRVQTRNKYGPDDFDIQVAVHPETWKVWEIDTPDSPPTSMELRYDDATPRKLP